VDFKDKILAAKQGEGVDFADFLERYEARFDEEGSVWAAQAYDCIMMIANAVEQGVKSSKELSKYLLENTDLKSIYGKTYFEPTREISGRSVYIKILENGKFNYLR
jgi:ABC-type branched-subunit amino acid transport system substrate-binding protein